MHRQGLPSAQKTAAQTSQANTRTCEAVFGNWNWNFRVGKAAETLLVADQEEAEASAEPSGERQRRSVCGDGPLRQQEMRGTRRR